MATKSSIDQLNSFLRGEISAVETYRMALEKLDRTSASYSELEANLRSHQERVDLLRNAITQLGGTPSDGSGPWGAFAKAVEGGAKVFGEKAAIAALEEGEDHGVKDYRQDLDDLDASSRQLIVDHIMPQQEMTHQRLSSLKKRLQAAS